MSNILQNPNKINVTPRQQRAIVNLIRRVGRKRYRWFKCKRGIPLDVTIPNLTKRQARILIRSMVEFIEESGR